MADCFQHPGVAAAAECVGCRTPLCDTCQEDVAGHAMCRPCVDAAQARFSTPAAPAGTPAAPGGVPDFGTSAPPASGHAVQLPPSGPAAWSPPEPSGYAAPPPPPPQGGWGQPDGGSQASQPWSSPPDPATYGAPAGLASGGYAPASFEQPPGLGLRLLRGWLWGIVFGQTWTLWALVSSVLFLRASFSGAFFLGMFLMAIVFGFFGSVAGIVIALIDADPPKGAIVGAVVGAGLLALMFLLQQNAAVLISVFFYCVNGYYLGMGLAGRVQAPVRR